MNNQVVVDQNLTQLLKVDVRKRTPTFERWNQR